MHSSRFAVCALLTLAASAGGQSTSMTASSQNDALPNPSSIKLAKCQTTAGAADNCANSEENTDRLPDLSPTQFLFGKQIGTKLSTPSPHSVTMKRVEMMDGSMEVEQVKLKAISPEYAVLLRLLVVPTAPVNGLSQGRQLTPAEQLAVKAQAERYLVEEWRGAQLEVADSVHHAVLERIGATYDSAQTAGVTGAARADFLRRLNDQARSNDYSWYLFRSEVNARADAARLTNSTQP